MHPNIWYLIILMLSGCMKQNNRQLPDSKLLSLFSTWQQWHQTASVQLTAVAPALMNNLRLASLLCLAGTSGDTCPVWGGTGALCPRHTWQWRDKSVTCPSVIRSPVWSLGSRQPVTHPSLLGIPELMHRNIEFRYENKQVAAKKSFKYFILFKLKAK